MQTALLLIAMLGADAESSKRSVTVVEFVKEATATLTELESKYSAFPEASKNDEPQDKAVREAQGSAVEYCINRIETLLKQVDSPEKTQAVIDLFANHLTRSKDFRFYEFYMLWMGGRVVEKFPPSRKDFILALTTKINRREELTVDWEVRNLYCCMAHEWLEDAVDAPIDVPSHAIQLDWDEWPAYADWVTKNYDKLEFDAEKKKWRVPPPLMQ